MILSTFTIIVMVAKSFEPSLACANSSSFANYPSFDVIGKFVKSIDYEVTILTDLESCTNMDLT